MDEMTECEHCKKKSVVHDYNPHWLGGDDESHSETCLSCGAFKTVITGQLDEEELENIRGD